MKLTNFQSKNGFTMVELLTSIAIIGIVSLGIGNLFFEVGKLQNKSNTKESGFSLRSTMIDLFKNESAVAHIISKNNSMSCLQTTPSTCSSSSTGTLDIYNGSGTLYYQGTNPTVGFDKDGNVCETFGQHPNCLLRYNITWKALCGSDCSTPQILVTGSLDIKNTQLPINPSHYKFEVIVPRFNDSLWVLCANKGKFFLPSGINGFSADSDGCIDPNAFKGAVGPVGPMGPAGAPAVCPTCP